MILLSRELLDEKTGKEYSSVLKKPLKQRLTVEISVHNAASVLVGFSTDGVMSLRGSLDKNAFMIGGGFKLSKNSASSLK